MDIDLIRSKQDNTAVHAYQEIDWDIVQSIVTERLSDFSQFVREIDLFLEK